MAVRVSPPSPPATYSALVAPEPAFFSHAEALGAGQAAERLKAHALSALTAVVPVTVAWYLGVDRRHRSHEAVILEEGRCAVEPRHLWRRYRATAAEDDPFT